MTLIDTHTHLDAPDFDADREMVIERARAAGVSLFLTVGAGYGDESAPRAVALAERYPFIFASIGIHPNDCSRKYSFEQIQRLASHRKVVAIGETGLDFYRDHASPAEQEASFIKHIELAKQEKKPLIIHSRQAGARCFQILVETEAKEVGGVFHCFAEDFAFAEKLKGIGFLVSVPGNITYKNATAFRESIEKIPLDQIMLETDAPFLAPQAFRGKRCESCFMVETAKAVAALKKVSLEELSSRTSDNARRLFKFG